MSHGGLSFDARGWAESCRRHRSGRSLELNRLFVEYQKFFGQAQNLGKEILKQLAG